MKTLSLTILLFYDIWRSYPLSIIGIRGKISTWRRLMEVSRSV